MLFGKRKTPMTIKEPYDNIYNNEIVIEKYLGGTFKKEFKIVEQEMGKIIKEINTVDGVLLNRKNPFNDQIDISKLNDSDSNLVIQKMLTKIFNLKEMSIVWQRNSPNAYTYINVLTSFRKVKDTEGRYSDPNRRLTAFIDVNLITYAGLTARETIGILLHEIGHSFHATPFAFLSHIPVSLATMAFPETILTHLASMIVFNDIIGIGNIMGEIDKFMSKIGYKYVPWYMKLGNLLNEIMLQFNHLPIRVNLAGLLNYASRVDFSRMMFGYTGEKFADNFATDYGYGKDLSTGLAKFERMDTASYRLLSNVPVVNVAIDLMRLPVMIFVYTFDEHPTSQNRITATIRRLEKNLKDPSIPKEQRKELETDLKELKKFYYDYYLNIEKNDNKKNIFSWAYMKAIDKVFGGEGDIRRILAALDEKMQ